MITHTHLANISGTVLIYQTFNKDVCECLCSIRIWIIPELQTPTSVYTDLNVINDDMMYESWKNAS